MQEAGFVTFLRTIAIILFVIYGMKFIAKYILPLVLSRAVKKAQERAQQYANPNESNGRSAKVGETIIDKKPSQTERQANDTSGDYVDFEEID